VAGHRCWGADLDDWLDPSLTLVDGAGLTRVV
jgi:hypothetical protein